MVINYSNSADAAQSVVKDIEKLGRKAIAVQADCSKPSEIASLFETAIETFRPLGNRRQQCRQRGIQARF